MAAAVSTTEIESWNATSDVKEKVIAFKEELNLVSK